MNENQSVAYLAAQTACALIEMESMKAANAERKVRGESPAYCEKDFLDLIESYGIHHNDAIEYLRS